ncbi:MAG: hypothetical protein JNM27_18975 [Leptospirales bacterium]|nr:hypothetical protein [Leptospirales bacterium]
MKHYVILLLLILHGACATSAWRSTWSDHPISETITLTALPDNARQNSEGVVFLRMIGIAPDDKPEFVCMEKPLAQYPAAESSYTYVRTNIRSAGDCPPLERASQLLVPLEASRKLLLPDLGIAISFPPYTTADPYYTGPSLKDRLRDVLKVERVTTGEIVITDSAGTEVILKSACCSDSVAFFQSPDPVSGTRAPLDQERLPPGRVIFASTADRKRVAYFIPSSDRLPQFFSVQQELSQTHPGNFPVRAGLIVLLPVVIAVDVVTAPIQIIVIAIVAKQAIETVEKFPRCLWP